MAFLLSNLGILGQMAGHGSHHKGIDPSAQTTNPYGASFGNVLSGQMDALGASDPLAQLTAVVQNGTPISTVVDRLTGLVSQRAGVHAGAVAKSIKSALSPPSKAPPGTSAAQQVTALARRLQTWIGGVAGGADQRAGQQSDTSGQVLDANRARELPAQTDPESASSKLDVSALARSLLAQVAASFGPVQSAQTTLAATPQASSSARAAVSAFSEAAKASTGQASTLARLQGAVASNAQDEAPAATTAAPQPEQSDAASLLARMLTRAAATDAQVNGNAVATATPQIRVANSGGITPHGEGVNFNQTTAAARLEAALGDIVAGTAQNRGGNASTDNQSGSSFRNASSLPGDLPTSSKAASAANSDAPAFTVPTGSPAQLFGTQSATSSGYGSSVDPSAIVEQVVRSMAMRTQSDGTSEVRMRLSPEHLGEVTLNLKVDGSNVSATAVAQNADVRNALISHQQQLARSLADSGLKLTSFSVNLSGGGAGNHDQRDRTSGFGRQYAVHEIAASGLADSTESPSGEPAIVPQSTLALFNYLA
ncbi:MAG TPA: flagellar hook-length control protein FliK [Candidatus Baltobacteraceae bacterium]